MLANQIDCLTVAQLTYSVMIAWILHRNDVLTSLDDRIIRNNSRSNYEFLNDSSRLKTTSHHWMSEGANAAATVKVTVTQQYVWHTVTRTPLDGYHFGRNLCETCRLTLYQAIPTTSNIYGLFCHMLWSLNGTIISITTEATWEWFIIHFNGLFH